MLLNSLKRRRDDETDLEDGSVVPVEQCYKMGYHDLWAVPANTSERGIFCILQTLPKHSSVCCPTRTQTNFSIRECAHALYPER